MRRGALFGWLVLLAGLGCTKSGSAKKDASPPAGDTSASVDKTANADKPANVDKVATTDKAATIDDAAPNDETMVRFVAVGDSGDGSPAAYEVGASVAKICQARGCDFIAFLGDNIYFNGVSSVDDPQFQDKFEKPFAPVKVPFMVALGNHDYGGNGTGEEFQKGAFEVAYTSHSQKWNMPAAYYHFVRGPAEFFVVDSTMQLWSRDDQQRTDVAGWIKASTATWKISYGHHPYRANGVHGNAGSYGADAHDGARVKTFYEQVLCGQTDFHVSGHEHSLEWLQETCNGTELVISGAGSMTTSLNNNNPTRFQALEIGFLYVKIVGKTLTADFIKSDDNTVVFTRTLTKG